MATTHTFAQDKHTRKYNAKMGTEMQTVGEKRYCNSEENMKSLTTG